MPGHPPPGRPGRSGRVYGGGGGDDPTPPEPRAPRSRPSSSRGGSSRGGSRPRTRDRAKPPARPAATAAGNPGAKRRRTPVWAVLTVVLGAALMLSSGVAIAGYGVLNDRYAGNVQEDDLLGEAAVDPGEELEGPINLLMLGVDEQGESDQARSDTIIVLHIPATHDEAYLMSVPRDTLVEPAGYSPMKLTDAFNIGYTNDGGWSGGAKIVASVIKDLTGLRFNGAAIVNFGGFKKIIDEMGGLEFCVDTEAYSEHLILVDGEPVGVGRARREGLYGDEIRYEVGCEQMAGWQVLDYARQRKTLASGEGDYGRQRHQVQMLRAMAAKATGSDVTKNLTTLDSLVLAAGDALTVDTNGVPLADFAFTLRNLRPNNLVMLQTNGGDYQSDQVNIGGEQVSVERLTPESVEMFQAAANDSIAQFIVNHPEFLAPEGPPEEGTEPEQ